MADYTSKNRQVVYTQKLKDSGKEMVKFPLEQEHIEQALKLFAGKGKQQALHDVLVLGLTGKTQDDAQINILDIERDKMLNKLAAVKALAAAARTEISKAASSPKTKQPDPSKIPTWKNLYRFLNDLEKLLND